MLFWDDKYSAKPVDVSAAHGKPAPQMGGCFGAGEATSSEGASFSLSFDVSFPVSFDFSFSLVFDFSFSSSFDFSFFDFSVFSPSCGLFDLCVDNVKIGSHLLGFTAGLILLSASIPKRRRVTISLAPYKSGPQALSGSWGEP